MWRVDDQQTHSHGGTDRFAVAEQRPRKTQRQAHAQPQREQRGDRPERQCGRAVHDPQRQVEDEHTGEHHSGAEGRGKQDVHLPVQSAKEFVQSRGGITYGGAGGRSNG